MQDLARLLPVTTRPRLERAARVAGWRVAVPALRARARRRLGALRPAATTVVTVNWNSWTHLSVLVDAVRRHSPQSTRILVVDNGSWDGTRDPLSSQPDVSALLLPVNVGHDLALDLGVLLSETEYVVALDVDAFPLHDRWLDELLGPLDAGAHVAGARLNRSYVHPCCCAMRTARFVREGHSFRARYRPRSEGCDASGDVGEEMCAREAPHLHFLEVSSQRGPGDVGTIFGGVVYHNFYATRFRATRQRQLDGVVEAGDAELAWEEALRSYLR